MAESELPLGLLVNDSDYLQLSRLLTEMVWRMDNGHAATIHELFVEDGILNVSDIPVVGKDALRDWGIAFDKAPLGFYHVINNPRFVADGVDKAKGTSMLVAFLATEDGSGSTVPAAVGIDHDTFTRTPQGWRLASRRWQPLFTR